MKNVSRLKLLLEITWFQCRQGTLIKIYCRQLWSKSKSHSIIRNIFENIHQKHQNYFSWYLMRSLTGVDTNQDFFSSQELKERTILIVQKLQYKLAKNRLQVVAGSNRSDRKKHVPKIWYKNRIKFKDLQSSSFGLKNSNATFLVKSV